IGGQGQYLAGSIAAVIVATELPHAIGLPRWLLIVAAILGGMLAGAALAGLAGLLKGTVGAHRVITATQPHRIVIYGGSYLFGLEGPLQTEAPETSGTVPSSADIPDKAKLPGFWGDTAFGGVHIGIFLALAALVVYSLVLNRTTLGYEVRAV